MPGTDFSRLNNLRPVSERGPQEAAKETQEAGVKRPQQGRHAREISPSLCGNSTMYQSLRSYVGEYSSTIVILADFTQR